MIGKMVVPIPRTLSRWQRSRRTLHPVRTMSNGSVAIVKGHCKERPELSRMGLSRVDLSYSLGRISSSFSGNSIDEVHSVVAQLVSDGVPNYHSSIISAFYAACRYAEQNISVEGSSLSALVHGSQRRFEWRAAWQIFCPGQQFFLKLLIAVTTR